MPENPKNIMRSEEEAAAAEIWGTGIDDYSAAATVVPFDPPLPLLRGPIPAAPSDDPSAGPFLLAFPDARTWRSAFRASESKITEQCESGARIGCSISSSSKCKPLWWKSLFGIAADDFAEREQCEEREMSSCLAASKEACTQFAKEKSLPPFRDARIALFAPKGVPKLAFWASQMTNFISEAEDIESNLASVKHETSSNSSRLNGEVTSYRGSLLLEIASVEDT